MIPQTTEERTAEYTGTATPDFQAACESLDKACGIATRYIPPFTNLQSASMQTVLQCLPQGIEFTAIALFNELEDVIRDLRNQLEKPDDKQSEATAMKVRLQAFLMQVAPLVQEQFTLADFNSPQQCFLADRIISKVYRLLAPGNIKSWNVSNDTPVRSVSPEPQSAAWFRAQRQAAPEESEDIVAGKIWTTEDHNKAVAAIKGVPIPVTDEDLAGADYEELKELRFQNAELSRQLECAQSSEKQYRRELGVINNAIQPFREELFAAERTHVSIDHIVSRLVFAWNNYKAEACDYSKATRILDGCREHLADFCTREGIHPDTPVNDIVLQLVHWYRSAMVREGNLENQVNTLSEEIKSVSRALQPFTAITTWGLGETMPAVIERLVEDWKARKAGFDDNIEAVQKERDELAELVSDIKLVLANHLSDDPLFNVVPVAEIIEQKLVHLETVSAKAHKLGTQEAMIHQQASRLVNAGIMDVANDDVAGVVQTLVSYRLGAHAAQKQKDAEHAAAPVIASPVADLIPTTYALIQDKRSPFVKAGGIHEFRTENPTIEWVSVGDFDIPVPLVKSAIMMAGGSKMPDGQPIHLSHVAKQLSLLPDAGTALGRCFGSIIGKLRDGTATPSDADESIARRLEKHRVAWPSPEGA